MLPLPPPEMRALVGATDPSAYAPQPGELALPPIVPASAYRSVFDFGCGCGRVARRLLLQAPRPLRYLGIDLHAGMIRWCRENLVPLAPTYTFLHHDAHYEGWNPGGSTAPVPFPVAGERFSLVTATSVFTHLVEPDIPHYLAECGRVLEPGGVFYSTWFLFDKAGYPMMQEFQNCLYINHVDPVNAVIADYRWLEIQAAEAGLAIAAIEPPAIRGFQWQVVMKHASEVDRPAVWPDDLAPLGIMRPPMRPEHAELIGR